MNRQIVFDTEFLMEPTRELNTFDMNFVHFYSVDEFQILEGLICFYIESQVMKSLQLCQLLLLLPLRCFIPPRWHSLFLPSRCLSRGP